MDRWSTSASVALAERVSPLAHDESISQTHPSSSTESAAEAPITMAKSQNSQKQTLKKALKTPAEKKAAKREKKRAK
jgi:hypothetical protein